MDMDREVARRDFLKTAQAAVGMLAYGQGTAANAADQPKAPAAAVIISGAAYSPVLDYPMQPKRYSEVKLQDAFWEPRIATNAKVTIPFEVQKLTESGSRRGFSGGVLEAAILSLQTHADASLQAQVEASIQRMKQAPGSGNSGFEIAAAYFNATGDRGLIDNAVRSADALYENFRAHNPPFSGGERDAINCVQLFRVTHNKKHLDLAKHYLDIRGLPSSVNRSRHNQSYKPVLEQSEAVGHAVNCVSLMVSLADVGVLTGLHEYLDTALRMWQDTVTRKLYITGGVGSTGNEGFGEPYALPNISAYAETCAVLMYITLNHKLFLATGDSRYIDVMERGMYNNAVDGVSASGNRFFYVNRLASAGDGRDNRWERASLECCPPNLVRFLAGMPGLIYAQDQSGAIYINLYVSSEASFQVNNRELSLSVASEMPWGGKSRITISAKEEVNGEIRLRVPGWARNQPVPSSLYSYLDKVERQTSVSVNGKPFAAAVNKSGYVPLDRNWKDGDFVEIEFPFEARKAIANPRVKEDRGRIAVERGPVVYCAEWPDVTDGHVLDLLFDAKAELKPSFEKAFYGGATVMATEARRISNPSAEAKPVKLIPYSLWANREAGEMSVWLSKEEYAIGDTGPAGGVIFYENPNDAADGWRYLEAAPFDQSAGTKWGCFRKALAGARGTAVGTGKQNTQDILAACSEPDTAAALCANLSVNGVCGWFLPSRDELAWMYRNLKTKGVGDFRDGGVADNFTYWASSEETADMAAHIDFADHGRQHVDDKDFPRRVRAIRAF
jgi:hypothetical protein